MTLTDFGELTLEERGTAWAEMDASGKTLLIAPIAGWRREEHLGFGRPRTVWLDQDGKTLGPTRSWNPSDNPTAAHELLMWVREQPREFRNDFGSAMTRIWTGQQTEAFYHPAFAWLLFQADWPDAIARAVVEAAIAVSAEAHRQVAEESTELAQEFMNSLTFPEQHE